MYKYIYITEYANSSCFTFVLYYISKYYSWITWVLHCSAKSIISICIAVQKVLHRISRKGHGLKKGVLPKNCIADLPKHIVFLEILINFKIPLCNGLTIYHPQTHKEIRSYFFMPKPHQWLRQLLNWRQRLTSHVKNCMQLEKRKRKLFL